MRSWRARAYCSCGPPILNRDAAGGRSTNSRLGEPERVREWVTKYYHRMPMIKCPDCGREISDAALNCPGCGRPMGKGAYAGSTVTTQATGKSWKAIQLVGGLGLVIGIPLVFVMMPVGVGLCIVGLCVYIAGRVGAWWYHG